MRDQEAACRDVTLLLPHATALETQVNGPDYTPFKPNDVFWDSDQNDMDSQLVTCHLIGPYIISQRVQTARILLHDGPDLLHKAFGHFNTFFKTFFFHTIRYQVVVIWFILLFHGWF